MTLVDATRALLDAIGPVSDALPCCKDEHTVLWDATAAGLDDCVCFNCAAVRRLTLVRSDANAALTAAEGEGATEREEFEAWARGLDPQAWHVDLDMHPTFSGWTYTSGYTELAWVTWQAAWQARGGDEYINPSDLAKALEAAGEDHNAASMNPYYSRSLHEDLAVAAIKYIEQARASRSK